MNKLNNLTVKKSLKQKLEEHYKYFDKTKISPDPLEFPRQYTNLKDIEISAFISSIFAYGNIKQIMNILSALHRKMNDKPAEFLKEYSDKRGKDLFENIKYRFYSSADIVLLFDVLSLAYKQYGSLEEMFMKNYSEADTSIKNTLELFSLKLLGFAEETGEVTNGIKFMFPLPSKGSTCKRMNLFLRWMIRNDELDFGIWNKIKTSQLIIPVDTHVAKISKELKLTTLKNPTWKMAEQITDKLKSFDYVDPVKYDFAICHIGMRKIKF